MAKKCKTDLGEVWVSQVGGSLDGAFDVQNEDSAGNFDGIHSGDKIRGVCNGTHITFRRPATNSRYEYSGKFSSNGKKISGKRSNLKKKSTQATEDDEWEGSKTVTLFSKKPRNRR